MAGTAADSIRAVIDDSLGAGPTLDGLTVKVFADGADLASLLELAANPLISGFTTNPTLMRAAGISDYEGFARSALEHISDRPLSLEVFSDDFDEMARQARRIASWGANVFVKIPVTNTKRDRANELVARVVAEGVQVNVTALMTTEQVESVRDQLSPDVPAYVSVFAGRVADTGRDPVPIMTKSLEILHEMPSAELIWASPREVLNIFQADAIGCDVITVTHDLLRKLSNVGRDLDDFSLDTVKMFHRDAVAAGYSLAG
jgi:transaldolase